MFPLWMIPKVPVLSSFSTLDFWHLIICGWEDVGHSPPPPYRLNSWYHCELWWYWYLQLELGWVGNLSRKHKAEFVIFSWCYTNEQRYSVAIPTEWLLGRLVTLSWFRSLLRPLNLYLCNTFILSAVAFDIILL